MSARPIRSTPREPETMPEVLAAVSRSVEIAAPRLRIERKWGVDWHVGRDLVLAYGAFTHHVGIEFWRGTLLEDPAGLLEGTGKNLRHVKVRTAAEARAPALRALIREAVRLDRSSDPRTR